MTLILVCVLNWELEDVLTVAVPYFGPSFSCRRMNRPSSAVLMLSSFQLQSIH